MLAGRCQRATQTKHKCSIPWVAVSLPRRVLAARDANDADARWASAPRHAPEAVWSGRMGILVAKSTSTASSGWPEKRNSVELEAYTWAVQPEDAGPGATGSATTASGYLYGFGANGNDVIQVRAAGPVAEALLRLPQESHVLVQGSLAAPRSPPAPQAAPELPAPPAPPPPPIHIWATSVTLVKPNANTASEIPQAGSAINDSNSLGGNASSFGSIASGSFGGSMNGSGGGAGSASGNSWGTGSTGTSSHPDQTAAAAAPFGNAAGGGTRSQLVVTLWEELRANPTEWFDNRADKANGRSKPNSPDFRNKNDRTKAVWIIDRAAPFWASEWLQQHPPGSLVAASTAGASQFSSASSSSDDAALWEDLRQNPDKWWDNRARKTNPKAPDFVRKDDRAVALWINGRKPVPNWVPKFLMFLDEAKKINE